jgi:tellurium resistance protein TerD
MTIALSKGERVDLTKGRNLSNISVALGWDPAKYSGSADFDLDASAFLLDVNGKCPTERDMVFYNNLQHPSSAVVHSGDNLTGAGVSGTDKEIIKVNLKTVPANIDRITFTVTIFDYAVRKQNFGMVQKAFIRVVDDSNGTEIMKYDLGETFSTETAVIFGDLYRKDGEWKFQAVGTGLKGGLKELLQGFGLAA